MATVLASVVVGADPELIFECVRSMRSSAGSHELAVRVIDNRACDAAGLAALQTDSSVVVIRNEQMHGFASNHNRALSHADSDYVLIANDDLVFSADAVSRCIDFLERSENADVAALSPRLLNPDRTLQRSTYGFPTVTRALLDLSGVRSWIPHNRATDFAARRLNRGGGKSRFWSHDEVRDVDTFRGAAMFIRTAAWKDVGPLCEIARVGGEIAEWHRRCRDRGWRVVFFPEAEVTHFGSRTVGADPLLRSEYLKGYLVYFDRHGRVGSRAFFRTAATGVSAVRLLWSLVTADKVGIKLWATNVSILTQQRNWQA